MKAFLLGIFLLLLSLYGGAWWIGICEGTNYHLPSVLTTVLLFVVSAIVIIRGICELIDESI